jgi:hypothetical protein
MLPQSLGPVPRLADSCRGSGAFKPWDSKRKDDAVHPASFECQVGNEAPFTVVVAVGQSVNRTQVLRRAVESGL